ncbi:MAG TPA: hypothetical protein VGQ87_02845, partial [Patescibacteria group bacterium]|nr:hypothetical protein [Patescibacteria group bacterium]
MNYTHWLVILSGLISITGAFAYIRDTLRGKTKPNRVSWIMWAIAPLVGTTAAISAGADLWATFRVFFSGFLPLIIFAASFVNPKSFWKLTFFDILCGICSLLAFVILISTDFPRIAILLAALGDGFALLPTLRKAWKYPETETGLTYILSLISTLIVLPSIPVWNIENSAFQIYLLVANTLLILSIYRNRFRNEVL